MRLKLQTNFMLSRQIMELMKIKLMLIPILTKILKMIHMMEVLGLLFSSVKTN